MTSIKIPTDDISVIMPNNEDKDTEGKCRTIIQLNNGQWLEFDSMYTILFLNSGDIVIEL